MKKLKRIIKNILYNNYIYRLIINSKHNRSRMKYELIKKEIENAHSHTTIGRIKRKFPYNGKIALRIIIKAYERRYEKLHSNNEYYYKAEEIGEIYELEAKIEELIADQDAEEALATATEAVVAAFSAIIEIVPSAAVPVKVRVH